MAAALGYRPDGSKARLCFHLQQDAYDTDTLIGVLDQLKGFYAGQRVVLLWDGLSSHWSYKMRTYLDAQRPWLTVERLPAYAPELNPVEYLWANLKGTELASFTGDRVAEVADQASKGSNECATATAWSSASWLMPASASTMTRHPRVKGPNTEFSESG